MSCLVYFPPNVKVRNVGTVLGALMGFTVVRRVLDSRDGSTFTQCLAIEIVGIESLPTCCYLKWSHCNKQGFFLYHHEIDNPTSRMSKALTLYDGARWRAIAKKLVDFFGGEVDYDSDDGIYSDYVVEAKPTEEVSPSDGEAWEKLQERMVSAKPIE